MLSELTWDNLRGPAVQASIHGNIRPRVFFYGSGGTSVIVAGRVTDSDYRGNNPAQPVRQDNLQSHKGHTWKYSLAAGYVIRFKKGSLSPWVGYSKNAQRMYLLDGHGLNSTYHAKWKGFMAGMTIRRTITGRLHLETALRCRRVRYRAEANWNLVDAFAHPVSFRHTARGFGAGASLSLIYEWTKNLQPFLLLSYTYRATGHGIDELFYASGSRAFTRLNEAESKTMLLGAGLQISLAFRE